MVQLQAELRQIAGSELREERRDHTLQPTALVNEAFLRLARQHNLVGASKGAFLAAAAQTMRRILVDHARARQADKRGNRWIRISLSDLDPREDNTDIEILALNDALEALRQNSERMASVVELRYFGGLTVAETAASIGVSVRAVADDWAFARAWLKRAMAS